MGINRICTIRESLEYRALQTPNHIYCVEDGVETNFQTLERHVNRLANGLAEIGIGTGSHVAAMMANHRDHIITFLALAKLGAVWIPVNTNLRGASLEWVISKSVPQAMIIDADFWKQLEAIPAFGAIKVLILRNNVAGVTGRKAFNFSAVAEGNRSLATGAPELDEIRAVFFTSGTTGEPKGALLTERMLQTCAISAGNAADVQSGDVFLLWEPIYHTAGAQMCILALRELVTLVVVPRFSASRFWDQVRRCGVTKIHYLGGVLDILMKRQPSPSDRDHRVKIAFGAGCNRETWRLFEERFGVVIREAYGLTEGSCFTTVNISGKIGSIGKPYPYLEVRIVDDSGNPLPAGRVGEIIMRGKEPGLIAKGYLENPEATKEAFRDGWLYTGDLGRYDEDGDFYYVGRRKDSIRRRGENISAWEVERVLNLHPAVEESAAIGVKASIGEEELKVFIKCRAGHTLDPLDLVKWCEPRMPRYQIPRYIVFVEGFQRAPTQRILKETLSRDTIGCWDLERSGYCLKRSYSKS
jgi:crotonobetaine/carnitine-CoA ligase